MSSAVVPPGLTQRVHSARTNMRRLW